MGIVQRVSVVGNAGSGKSALGRRLAAVLELPMWSSTRSTTSPAGRPSTLPSSRTASVRSPRPKAGWVIDGNYRTVVYDGPVWQRADTVVWLDLPRSIVVRRLVRRTLKRIVSREELWNGNREPLRNLWAWDPDKSIICWSWTSTRSTGSASWRRWRPRRVVTCVSSG